MKLSTIILIIFAFVTTRIVQLGSVPKGFHIDEASFLLNTVSVLRTGKDEDNQRLPLFFNSIIDPKPALYSYLQAPFILLGGDSIFSARLPSVLLGLLSLPLTLLLFRSTLSNRHKVILIILMVISPWHIIVSRSTHEVILSFVFMLAAGYSFYKSLEQNKRWVWLYFFFTVLSMYAYHSAKVFLPLLFAGWILIEVYVHKKKGYLKLMSLAVIPFVCLFLSFAMFSGNQIRFDAIGFHSNIRPQLILEEQIRAATNVVPTELLRVFYNKITSYGYEIVRSYLQHFSAEYLFFYSAQPGRYVIPFQGLLYMVEAFLLPLGTFLALQNKKSRKWSLPMVWWLVIAPIPSALTYLETPSLIRGFTQLLPLLLFCAYAIERLWQRKHVLVIKGLLGLILVGYVYGFTSFLFQLYVQQPRYHPWVRNRAEEVLANRLVEIHEKYERVEVYAIRDVYAYLALANNDFIKDLQKVKYPLRRVDGFTMGNIVLYSETCTIKSPFEGKVLYVLQSNCESIPGFIIHESISYDDGVPRYNLFTYERTKTQ